MVTHEPTDEDRAFKADVDALLERHDHLPPMRLLALASQVVGILIALQDQTKVSPPLAMNVVAKNIEIGNALAIETHLGSPEGSA